MTRKHFEAVAACLLIEAKNAESEETRGAVRAIAHRLAAQFAAENPRFDAALFLVASGVEG